jgi:hypothetical protein
MRLAAFGFWVVWHNDVSLFFFRFLSHGNSTHTDAIGFSVVYSLYCVSMYFRMTQGCCLQIKELERQVAQLQSQLLESREAAEKVITASTAENASSPSGAEAETPQVR